MAKRRPSGDGMIRRRPNGSWEGRVVIGHNADQSAIFKYCSGKTQREMKEKLERAKIEYRGVDLCSACRQPLEDWLEDWLKEYVEPTVRKTTLSSYRQLLEDYVRPTLGEVPLLKLTTAQIRKLYRDLLDHGRISEDANGEHTLSPSTIRRVHGVLHQALDAAVRQNLIPFNPTNGITLPRKEVIEMKILNDDELRLFMEFVQEDPLWGDFFYTELTTGLRLGEICGLRWEDFNEDTGVLQVRRTVHAEEKGRLTTGETKTNQGRRDIILAPSTADLLDCRKRAGITEDWIFPNFPNTREPMNPGKPYRKLKEILVEANLPDIRFHDLRHTFATHALANGVDAKTLSGILGHTKPSFTLDRYTHVTGTMQKKAAKIVSGFISDMII